MRSIEETDDPDPLPLPEDPETARFLPLLCVAGNPGSADCPVNNVDLSDLDVIGRLDFVLQAVGSGYYFNQIQFAAGSTGLYIERPVLRLWPSANGLPVEHVIDATLNLPPHTGMPLPGGSTAVFALGPITAISMRFTAIGPYRP